MRLLIIDDDLQTVEVVRDSINWSLFNIDDVQIAYNVSRAKIFFKKKTPDIVISDIEMPKASGIELLKWVRENKFNTEFILFTCHENFEFATTALAYNVISYITKPFDIDKVVIAVKKAVEKIRKEQVMQEFKKYGEHWLNNKKFVQENFWRDILFKHITPNVSSISFEITRRNLPVNINDEFRLIFVSVLNNQSEDLMMEKYLFEYTLRKICSEVILDELYFNHTILYSHKGKYFVAVIVKNDDRLDEVKGKCKILIQNINDFLKCSSACYISDISSIYELADKREILEQKDQNNLIKRNDVFTEDDYFISDDEKKDLIDIKKLIDLLQKYKKIEIFNMIKDNLEMMSLNNKIDASIMHSIYQDFMQAIYAFLSKKGIQAHELFSDKALQKLNDNAENSILDLMRWINIMVSKTIDHAKEIDESMSIVDKAKAYIDENFAEDISKNEVSNVVFLSPDYLGKIFKSELGISINNYINKCRVEKAKELLLTTDLNISRIAAQVGFNNISYFSTVFRKEVGFSPYNYKKDNIE